MNKHTHFNVSAGDLWLTEIPGRLLFEMLICQLTDDSYLCILADQKSTQYYVGPMYGDPNCGYNSLRKKIQNV